MNLILLRHGNTFTDAQRPVYVGQRSDPELTQTGLFQAHRFADALEALGLQPSGLCLGLSKRLVQTGQILAQRLRVADPCLYLDRVLTELDYGAWEGQTVEQVCTQFGSQTVEAWNKHGQYPGPSSAWGQSENTVVEEAQAYVETLQRRFSTAKSGPVVLISSNGRLRYFLKLIPGAWEHKVRSEQLKIATGHVAYLHVTPTTKRVVAWNISPYELGAFKQI